MAAVSTTYMTDMVVASRLRACHVLGNGWNSAAANSPMGFAAITGTKRPARRLGKRTT